ncbi:MAG: hypothetical protein EOM67_05195 [Spirochaetia bacterium]|nr:hypothetical protein [Spirochaetia bacterium]
MDERKRIDEFVESLHLKEDVSPEEFSQAMLSAYQDRTRQVYFIWRKLKELYPEVDADKVIGEGSWDFGVYQGEQVKKKFAGKEIGPIEAITGQTSKGGWFVFKQEITELNEDKGVKIFHQCPHVLALEEFGLDKKEIKSWCRDKLGRCDFGICEPFEKVEIDFPTTVADGEGHGCAMTIVRKK